jgi:FixJ family two-component response regulator
MAQPSSRSPTVFVIDDDADVRAAIRSFLKSVGLRAETFESAQEFLSHERWDGPGCLVLDFTLSGMNGFEVERELSEAGVQMPIIFISGYGDIPTDARAGESRAVEFLAKPFGDQDLLDAIQAALTRDRTMRQT